jgi:hypothetical protein
MDERPDVVTIPTELERSDAAWDIAVGLGVLLGAVYCVKPPDMGGLGLPWPFLIPPLLPVALYVLTGEYAGDLPWIGGVASGLRSKLGARRAHEWIQAYGWYARVTLIPNGRDWCRRSYRFIRRQTFRWRRRLSVRTTCWRSAACSWACHIRSSFAR